jgi:hypothetical protein
MSQGPLHPFENNVTPPLKIRVLDFWGRLGGGLPRLVLYTLLAAPLGVFLLYAFSQGWFFPAPFPETWTSAAF